MISEEPDEKKWMSIAISLAKHAASRGEVPVGAIIVKDNNIVASGYNLREASKKVTSHAEILALEKASELLDSWRLIDCELYVTLEPCLMCAGAIYQARLKKVVFGAFDPKAGAMGSLFRIHEDLRLNHRFPVKGGILEAECSELLRQFFAQRRGIR